MSQLASIIAATQKWVNEVVVGLNFCPFAKREVVNNSIDYQVIESGRANLALQAMLDKLVQMDANTSMETCLLIYPTGFDDFEDYLDLLSAAEGLIEQGGYSGIYQLASFHPNYVFEGEDENDASHFTNRAPYPMLHILREASIERVLRTYPDPESIPENNIRKARELGQASLASLLRECLSA